jgi:hypothetical protein
MNAVIQYIRSELDEMTACNKAADTEHNPGMMQSIKEHQEIPKEDAVVMPVGGPRKWNRVCNLAADSRQKIKKRTQGYCGSRRKSAASCRKVSRCAKMAWRKRNVFRKIETLEKCGRHKEFAAAGMRTTRYAKVARREDRSHEGPSVEQGRRKEQIRKKFSSGTQKGWMFGKR